MTKFLRLSERESRSGLCLFQSVYWAQVRLKVLNSRGQRPIERTSGSRRRVEPIEGSEFVVEADTVIVAIGQAPQPLKGPGEKKR